MRGECICCVFWALCSIASTSVLRCSVDDVYNINIRWCLEYKHRLKRNRISVSKYFPPVSKLPTTYICENLCCIFLKNAAGFFCWKYLLIFLEHNLISLQNFVWKKYYDFANVLPEPSRWLCIREYYEINASWMVPSLL